ncbi:MAG: hypothetical protein PHI47_06045 [Sulfuricurvum sp.]|uniref:hypothetical protein n=1 Tax=Sulfuricurvum sp. TaxID=2025608 RepID=UPI00262CCE8E|nr:hypothetical protein [Sulfuricurvum sp.]MDD5159593.1 hypothetical protein [Sulfuricurvum sp.]
MILGVIYVFCFLVIGIFSNGAFYSTISIFNIIFFGGLLLDDVYKSKASWIKNIKFIVVVGFSLTFLLSFTGFCFERMQYISQKDMYLHPMSRIVSELAEHGLAKKKFVETQSGRGYDYDDTDIQKIAQNVDDFLKKHPENIHINHNYSFDQSETYDVLVTYLFSEDEIDQINAYITENGKKEYNKKIIGISYWQSYSACGHPTNGMKDYIYEDVLKFEK